MPQPPLPFAPYACHEHGTLIVSQPETSKAGFSKPSGRDAGSFAHLNFHAPSESRHICLSVFQGRISSAARSSANGANAARVFSRPRLMRERSCHSPPSIFRVSAAIAQQTNADVAVSVISDIFFMP